MFKRFVSYYKPHMGLFTLDMICAVIVAACNLYYPTLAKKIINEYSLEPTVLPIVYGALALLGVYIVKAVGTYIIGYYGHIVGVRMQADMRRDLFAKYESFPYSYFDERKTGDLLSRLTGDLQNVSELAHHGPENVLLSVLMLIGSFLMLFSIDKTLTLIMFAVIPFIVLFTVLSRKNMSRAMKGSRVKMSEINTALENSITGIRETKAYVAEQHEMCKFEKANSDFKRYRSMAMRSLGSFDSIMHFLQDLLYLTVLFVGGIFLMKDRLDSGEFAAFVLYVSMFLNPIQRFVTLFEQLQEGMAGFSRFHEVMTTPSEEDNGTLELTDLKGDIELEDVSFSYQGEEGEPTPVINGLNLKIAAGTTLALVGPSGGGKTTLCNLIPRFYPIKSGRITIDGKDINDLTLKSLRSSIGIVSQSVFLFDGTVRENIAYGCPDATDEQLERAARLANIHDFISTLPNGYETQVGERGVKLSGGQKQRVAIARVFLKDPGLLILDEATSALDNVTELQIQESLEMLAKGRTVIVVAHRLSTVRNADRIVVIDKGGVVESGTHDELIALGGSYSRLHSKQLRANTL